MAVRESEDRRLGGQPEKLVTLEEAARRLGVPADDVEAMIRSGRLKAFRLGGNLLRVRLRDLEEIQTQTKPQAVRKTEPSRPAASSRAPSASPGEDRLLDFLYFNDFYLVAILIILTLLAIIFAL